MTSRSRTSIKRALGRDRRGAAALEFAIIAVPFLGLMLGIFNVAYDLYLQEALDYSLQTAVRQIQLGHVPSTYGAGDFTSKIFCPLFANFADCGAVLISVQPVTDFQTASEVGQPASAIGQSALFCIGAPGQLMFARAVYLAPVLSHFWSLGTVVTLGGSTGNALMADAAFANENPSGAAIPGGAGC